MERKLIAASINQALNSNFRMKFQFIAEMNLNWIHELEWRID